jgi:chitosanase
MPVNVPCADCAATQQRYIDLGFTNVSCAPLPQRPGMCVVKYTPPAVSAVGAGALAPKSINHPMAAAVPAAAAGAPPVAAAGPSPLTRQQVQVVQAIINIFETSQVLGNYGQVTLLPNDPGRLTYGRSQTTLASGNLLKLLQRYVDNPGARFGPRLRPWLPAVAAQAAAVDTDGPLHNVLRACADDPVMRETQDQFFDDEYWKRAHKAALDMGLGLPLSIAVVYDGFVHGSWSRIRDQTTQQTGSVSAVGEEAWIEAYVDRRRAWLANHTNSIIRKTAYRMEAFQRLIANGQWGLALPLVVRQQEISTATLSATPPGCFDGPLPGTRALAIQQPLQRGLDVRMVQLGLSDEGLDIKADGVFGEASMRCVREYQIAHGLPATGAADLELIGRLVN